MNIINQISSSPYAQYFKPNIMERWGLKDYHNPNAPCLFFGVRGQEEIINNHKGFKLLYFMDVKDIFPKHININNLACFFNPYSNIPETIPTKEGWFETRTNTQIKPSPLGDKIFVYLRGPSFERGMGLNELNTMKKYLKYEVITLSPSPHIPFPEVIKNYYNKCFISINFTSGAGLTTVCDLGLMGRKTIMNTNFNLNSVLNSTSIQQTLDLIDIESKKIGSVPPPINNYSLNDMWRNVDFWIN